MGSDAGSWDINIVIDAIDEATGDLNKVSQALDKVDSSTDKVSGTTQKARVDFTAFNQALEVGEKALQYTRQAYEALIDPTMEYAAQVRNLKMLTGMTAEDTSKLIQVNDDLGISFQTLQSTMEIATKKGYQLSIESLAKMSDEYNTLSTAVEKSQYLTDRFGRSGNDIAMFMGQGGDAIRAMSDAISDNMILTQRQIDQAEKFRITEDNLTDTLTGVGYAIGNGLIPWLQKAGDATLLLLNWTNELNNLYNQHRDEVTKTATNYSEYTDELLRSAVLTGQITQFQLDAANATGVEGTAVEMLGEQAGILSEAQWEWARSSRAAALEEYEAARNADDATVALGGTEQAALDAALAQDALKTAVGLVNAAFGELTTQMLYQQAAAGLDAESTLLLARHLGLLDENTYSALKQVQDFKAGLDAGADGILSMAEGAGQLITKVDGINNSMVELYPGLTTTQTEMLNAGLAALDLGGDMETAAGQGWGLNNAINAIHDKSATVTVEFIARGDTWVADYTGGGYNFVIEKNESGQYGKRQVRASGGPASGMTWVGEQGPELVNLPNGSYVNNARDSAKIANADITNALASVDRTMRNLPDMIARSIRDYMLMQI